MTLFYGLDLCQPIIIFFLPLSECESLRSGTPVKSDISGTGSVSGYGTGGDSGSDKTPPYLPTSKNCHYATLGHPGKCNKL